MSSIPANLRYVDSHEWIQDNGDGTVTIGITDHAQEALGDVVFVDLPEVGTSLAKGDEFGVIESVKAASDISAPVAGVITAINADLAETPGGVNDDPMAAWFFRIKPAEPDATDGFMDEAAYHDLIG